MKRKIIQFCNLFYILSLCAKVKGQNIPEKRPNIVMLIADDLGIGDLGCFGNDTIKTPNIDRLAKEGIMLRHHLAAASLCTPSRAALVTGRYPARFGLTGDKNTPPVIVHIASKVGLPDSEITIAEALSSFDYSTALVGKWHLGSGCGLFGSHCTGPLAHGFDFFYGLPFSLHNRMDGRSPFWIYDMNDEFYQAHLATFLLTLVINFYFLRINWKRLSLFLGLVSLIFFSLWFLYTHYRLHKEAWWKVSDWMGGTFNGVVLNNGEVVHRTIPYHSISRELVNQSIEYIRSSAEAGKPFFLVHAFTNVHIPLYSSAEFSGRSKHGRYGDNVEELDYGVGVIMKALKENDIDENTLVYFVSDHGGHLEAVDSDGQRVGGFNKKFKGGKGMGAAEGGIRVPGIFRWKGVLPSGSYIDTPTSMIDIFPTFLDLAGLPEIHKIYSNADDLDGVSFAHLLRDPNAARHLERILVHHCGRDIHGLRMIKGSRVYKMYLHIHQWKPNSYQCGWGLGVMCGCINENTIDLTAAPLLYELISDPYEDTPIDYQTDEYKEVVAELLTFLRNWKEKNPYPPSLFGPKLENVLLPWLQPF